MLPPIPSYATADRSDASAESIQVIILIGLRLSRFATVWRMRRRGPAAGLDTTERRYVIHAIVGGLAGRVHEEGARIRLRASSGAASVDLRIESFCHPKGSRTHGACSTSLTAKLTRPFKLQPCLARSLRPRSELELLACLDHRQRERPKAGCAQI